MATTQEGFGVDCPLQDHFGICNINDMDREAQCGPEFQVPQMLAKNRQVVGVTIVDLWQMYETTGVNRSPMLDSHSVLLGAALPMI